MGFGAIAQPATAGPTEGASVDACLLTARATGADGDTYRVTATGQLLTYYKPLGTPGWLVPGNLYADISAPVSNASGSAYFTLSDDEDTDSDLTNRGWVRTPGLEPSKTANNPLILDSAASSKQILFTPSTPTATTTDILFCLKIEFSTLPSTNDLSQTIDLIDGNKRRLYGSGRQSNSTLRWHSTAAQIGYSNIDLGNSAGWLWSVHAGSTSYISTVTTESGKTYATAEYNSFNSFGALNAVNLSALDFGQQSVVKVYEFLAVVLS